LGYRISWLARRSEKDALLAALGLADTGEPDEANEAPFSAAELPTGWTVIWANDEEYASQPLAERLSRDGEPAIAVHVNETCMHSTAALFEAGECRWYIHHEGDERIDFVEIEGIPPPETETIVQNLRARQTEEDAGSARVDHLFDIPLEVARAVCGYKHDYWRFDWGEPSFTRAVVLSERGWFGKRRP
jgi:hypothetical protein